MDKHLDARDGLPQDAALARVAADPAFGALVRRRGALGRSTVLLTMAIYFGYLALLAFAPGLMRTRVAGVVTAGFPIGLAVMLATVLIVLFYVRRASTDFERMTADIIRRGRA